MRQSLSIRSLDWGLASLAVLSAACGGKVIYAGSGPGGDGTGGGDAFTANAVSGAGSPTGSGGPAGSGGGNIDLEPICKSFCSKYQVCAPQTDCKLGCMSSPVLACKKEYAADVVCITDHLDNCAGFSEPCAEEQKAYQTCEEMHP